MNNIDIINKIIAKRTKFDVNNINVNITKDDLGMDSLDAIEIVMDLEEKFNLSINENIFDNLQNMGQLYKFIDLKLKENV